MEQPPTNPAETLPLCFQIKKINSISNAKLEIQLCSPSSPLPDLAPMFNNDRNFFTPAFVLPIDQMRCRDNQQQYHNVHIRKVAEAIEQKIQILQPKPSKHNSYCCTCKTAFTDYHEHLRTHRHQQLLKSSDYRSMITQLCGQFSKTICVRQIKEKKEKKTKRKMIHKLPSLKSLGSGRQTAVEDSYKEQQLI